MARQIDKKKIDSALSKVVPGNEALRWLRQPNNLTYLRGNLTKPQLNMMNEIIDILQERISQRLREGKTTLFDDADFMDDNGKGAFPVMIRMSEIAPANKYSEVADTAERLAAMTFGIEGIYNGEKGTFYVPIFDRVFIPEYRKTGADKQAKRKGEMVFFIKQEYSDEIWKLSSYTRYLKEVAKSCSSQYSIRIYMLLAAQKRRGRDESEWKVEYPLLHSLFGYSKYKAATKNSPAEWSVTSDPEDSINKYKTYRDFNYRVLRSAFTELNKMDGEKNIDIHFDYTPVYESGVKTTNPDYIVFRIYKTALGKREDDNSAYARECVDMRREMMETLDMTKSQCDQVMSLVTEEHLPVLQSKVKEMQSYFQKHADIQGRGVYALKSIKSALLDATPTTPAEEIKDLATVPAASPAGPSSLTPHPSPRILSQSKDTHQLSTLNHQLS